MNSKRIPRRSFLRTASALIPLPLLDVMTPTAARAETSAPLRLVWLFQANGFYPQAWNPSGTGADWKLSRVLRPFEPFRNHLTVIRNLRTIAQGPHIGKCSAFLTAIQAQRDPQLGLFASGKSVDQWVFDHIGGDSLLRSLHLGIEYPGQGYCSGVNTPVAYGATVSWRNRTTRVMPEVTPRAAFDLLFARPTGPQAAEQSRWQGSILDSVRDQAKQLYQTGSAADRQRLDEYLESIRSVETRIQRATLPPHRSWTPPTRPAEREFDPPPPGAPADRRQHVRQMLDLITLALWTDSTRVATLMYANSLSEADFRFIDGVQQSFHSGCSHHQSNPEKIEQYIRINEWHAQQTAYLLNRLEAIREGDGTLLDHSVVFFGSSLKDGQEHANTDLPVVMAGGLGGRIKHAGHLICPEDTNIANLHLTTVRWFGIQSDGFNGMSTGPISQLA